MNGSQKHWNPMQTSNASKAVILTSATRLCQKAAERQQMKLWRCTQTRLIAKKKTQKNAKFLRLVMSRKHYWQITKNFQESSTCNNSEMDRFIKPWNAIPRNVSPRNYQQARKICIRVAAKWFTSVSTSTTVQTRTELKMDESVETLIFFKTKVE